MTMTLIRQTESLILWLALRRKYTDVILLPLHNAVFNEYNSVAKSRSRINRIFSWKLTDFTVQPCLFT